MSADAFACSNSNVDGDGSVCKKLGRFACKSCLLVLYCGADCQKADWLRHKGECKSALGKPSWEPSWAAERRTPAFIRGGIGQTFGARKYLWGNVPAIDVVNLASNEGREYDGEINLLFAASGDARNLLKSIAGLPDSFAASVKATVNDRDPDIVARNIIILLVALAVEDLDEAADCILHVWYSAFIRPSHVALLRRQVRPLIDEVVQKIRSKSEESRLGKTWSFGRCKLRIVLKKSSWQHLLSCLDIDASMTTGRARELRAGVVMADVRRDYRERHLFCQPYQHRLAVSKFRQDGILLPFGAPRQDFTQPNPTFFSSGAWPMTDGADPRNGWSAEEVAKTSSGAASNDIYGKFYRFILGEIRRFVKRISTLDLSLEMLQVDALSLPKYLQGRLFSRIEVSNIADVGWLGLPQTLAIAIPLLQAPRDNPHATLLTLFLNAVEEATTEEDKMNSMSVSARRLQHYLPLRGVSGSQYDPRLLRFSYARDLVSDPRPIFMRYTTKCRFGEVAHFLDASQKVNHTIIEQWPYRLKLQPGDPGAQEEFDRLFSGGLSGTECYLEWRKNT